MKKLNSREIREKFLQFFENHDHLKISGASLVPKNDPTLLFINSGMAPMKNFFLGKEKPPHPRMVNFQPCIRTKDIDDVGDRHHLTLFEMMGSWSIGDYYKEEACRLAYKLLVEEFGFEPKKLYMTVYDGNTDKGIGPDEESVRAWKKCGVPDEHIIRLGEDNFWGPAGETGPCGPCTEVFYDTGEEHGPEYRPGGYFDDKSRYIEIWNAGVFMEYNKNPDGTFTGLPMKSVDTGSGLERMAMVMNGFESVYETDLMAPLMKLVETHFGITELKKKRMMVDHLRASTMIMSEGVAPSNEGQGYIPRRLIRKCVSALVAKKKADIDFTVFVDKVIELLGPHYPLLKSGREACLFNFKAEVEEFAPIITKGLNRIEEVVGELKEQTFPAVSAFELVTTFGLPFEVLISDLEERGLSLDQDEYEACWDEHRKRSRVISRKGGISADEDALEHLIKNLPDTKFTGYEDLQHEGKVIALIKDLKLVDHVKTDDDFFMITDITPFYAESGGQAGDVGKAKSSASEAFVLDTQKIQKVHVHSVKLKSGELKMGQTIELSVEPHLRIRSRRHHSATHLLHRALHLIIGKHAVQKGSMVRPDRLRFDFQHNQALKKNELEEVEQLVNRWIRDNYVQGQDVLDYDQALEKGALALFGEKYDSKVRVISFGDSVELCGGTHVERTGEIGVFVITSESAVAKGVRRIEAVVGEDALEVIQHRSRLLKEVSEKLNTKPEQALERIEEMRQKIREKNKKAPTIVNADQLNNVFEEKIGPVTFFLAQSNAEAKEIKALGDKMIDKGDKQVVCLVGKDERSLKVFTWVDQSVQKKIKAGDLLKQVLIPVEGKGGGRPNFAQGGSPKVDLLSRLFENQEKFKEWIKERVS
jgi:alanyl-tRNA synthetase